MSSTREDAIRQLRNMNANSIVKVTADFCEIVRLAGIRDDLTRFDETCEIRIVDLHNSIIRYIRRVMPGRIETSAVVLPAALPDTTPPPARCCPLIERLYRAEYFDFDNRPMKWGMIARNIVEINGMSLTQRENPIQVTGARPKVSPEKQEDRARKLLFQQFMRSDMELERQNPKMAIKRQSELDEQTPPKKWCYNAEAQTEHTSETKDARPTGSTSVNHKTTAAQAEDDGDRCMICMDAKITHGFLHFGLANQNATLHYIACERCADTWMWATKGCPKCRQPVVNIVRVTQ